VRVPWSIALGVQLGGDVGAVFLGADGLVAGRGLCAPTLEQAQLKQVML
jgi:hypothetical protein